MEKNAEKGDREAVQANYRQLQTHVKELHSIASATGNKEEQQVAGRSDMDRLLTDISNHTKKLGELIASRGFDELKQSSFYLREDVKSLARKSTGLSSSAQARLEEKRDAVIELTQHLEKNVEKADQEALQANYRRLKTTIQELHSLVGGTKAVGEQVVGRASASTERLLTSISNHNRKLKKAISSQDLDEVKQTSSVLRNEVKALTKESTGLSEYDRARLEERIEDVVQISAGLERNAKKENYTALKENYERLQASLKKMESILSEDSQKVRSRFE